MVHFITAPARARAAVRVWVRLARPPCRRAGLPGSRRPSRTIRPVPASTGVGPTPGGRAPPRRRPPRCRGYRRARHVVFAAHRHRRHHAAQAFGASGQEQAPHEGVDGGAAGQRVARQVAVHRGQRAQVRQDEQQDGCGVEHLGEAGRGGTPLGEARRVGNGGRLRPRGRSPAPRAPGQLTRWRGTRTSRSGRCRERGAGGGVLDHDARANPGGSPRSGRSGPCRGGAPARRLSPDRGGTGGLHRCCAACRRGRGSRIAHGSGRRISVAV